jgi:hypothetical protein
MIESRTLRLAALFWVVGFLVVFVPAHQRGIVSRGVDRSVALPSAGAQTQKPYCPLCVVSRDGEPAPADAPVNCAVCHLKAGLDLPAAVVLPPHFFAALDFLIGRFSAGDAPTIAGQITLHGRAPPRA